MLSPRAKPLLGACLASVLAAVGLAGCGSPGPRPPAGPTTVAPKVASPGAASPDAPSAFDPCVGSSPPPHAYLGLLRDARCDQEMFLTMAGVASQLGVACRHCHVPDPKDAKGELYPVMTPKKEIANWMSMHLMQAIKPADGSPMRCKSCHVGEDGKPVAKVLGEPRDIEKAQEWMSLVMVGKFVSASGEKLRCKSCHAGGLGSPEWQPRVLLRSAQLPAHAPPVSVLLQAHGAAPR